MRKYLLILFAMLILLLASCNSKHEHTMSEWRYSETEHWRVPVCGRNDCTVQAEVHDYGEHIDENVDNFCDICNYSINKENENINIEDTIIELYIKKNDLKDEVKIDKIYKQFIKDDKLVVPFLIDYYADDVLWDEKIGEISFYYRDSRGIEVYYNNVIYTLKEAFDNGLLTQANLIDIAKIQNENCNLGHSWDEGTIDENVPTGEKVLVTKCYICGETNSVKEYTGPKIVKITHTSIDYMGGYTEKDELDFIENKYSSLGYMPTEVENPELELKSTFTDEEEKIFIDECYLYGLFDIEESYRETGIIDGGGWSLIIEYEDGTTKISRGDNAGPTKVFNKCAIVFYDLCGEGVVGRVPESYIYPPRISMGFKYEGGWVGGIVPIIRADYKWNKNESINNDYFQLNEAVKDRNQLDGNYSYKLDLYTANYACDEKFIKITVKEYDYNSELTNEKTIYTGEWFYQIILDIQINKIYVYELTFEDGDYVQYTFSTYCK